MWCVRVCAGCNVVWCVRLRVGERSAARALPARSLVVEHVTRLWKVHCVSHNGVTLSCRAGQDAFMHAPLLPSRGVLACAASHKRSEQ
jgi:hypothetical protein